MMIKQIYLDFILLVAVILIVSGLVVWVVEEEQEKTRQAVENCLQHSECTPNATEFYYYIKQKD